MVVLLAAAGLPCGKRPRETRGDPGAARTMRSSQADRLDADLEPLPVSFGLALGAVAGLAGLELASGYAGLDHVRQRRGDLLGARRDPGLRVVLGPDEHGHGTGLVPGAVDGDLAVGVEALGPGGELLGASLGLDHVRQRLMDVRHADSLGWQNPGPFALGTTLGRV